MSVTPTTVIALIVMLIVGAIVAMQPPINAELGRRSSVLAAALISSLVTFACLGTLFIVFGDFSSLGSIKGISPIYFLGGLAGACWVGASLVTVRYLGAGGVVAAAISAQLIVGAILDRFGVLGLERLEFTPVRAIGFAALILGTILVTLR